jgi:hypothetical protein
MRFAALLSLALLLAPAARAGDAFEGRYDWGTGEAPDPVWTLQDTGNGLRMRRHDGHELPVRELDAAARAGLWDHLDWPAGTAPAVRCVGWADEPGPFSRPLPGGVTAVICRVPADVRARIDWIRDYTSDWIYYDTGLGVAALRRID